MKAVKRILALLLCLLLLVAAAACAKTENDPSAAPSESGSGGAADVPSDRRDASSRTGSNATNPFVISTLQLDGKFTPFYATSGYDDAIVEMTQLTLITSNENAEPVAGLNENTYALSYTMTVAEDQSTSTYQFILKNGLTFSDGTPVTGKDLLFTLYEYLDPAYSGSGTLYSMDIQGLTSYRNQVLGDDAAAGKDAEFAAAAQERVQAVIDGTGTEADVALAWELVKACIAADSGVLISSGYTPADFALAQPDDYAEKYSKTILLSYMGLIEYTDGAWVAAEGSNVDVSKLESYTEEECINLAYAYVNANMTVAEYDEAYGYDVVTDTDAGVSQLAAALKKEIAAAYLEENKGTVKSISGITLDTVETDGVTRERLTVVLNGVDPKAIWNFSIQIAPMHYYSTPELTAAADGKENFGVEFNSTEFQEHIKKNVVPMGAGPYVACDSAGNVTTDFSKFYSDGIVYFVANDNFMLGAPNIKYLRYKTITMGSEIDNLLNGEVHYSDPQAGTENINKLSGTNISHVLVDNLGYGYIGINAKLIPDLYARRALAYAMNVELTLDMYPGGLAEVIYRPMSKVSWAYPQDAEDMYPFDGTGEKSKEMFLMSDNYKEVDGKIVNKDGSPVTFTFTLPSEAATHPAGAVFTEAQATLAKIGVEIIIDVDANVLNKLETDTIAVWAAAWSSTIDPDMHQIYCSDPSKNTAGSPKAFGLYYKFTDGSAEEKEILTRLNELIEQGRNSLNVAERKPVYAEACDLVMEMAVEIPTYQRKNMYAYNSDVLDDSTFFQNITPYKGPIAEIWNVSLK